MPYDFLLDFVTVVMNCTQECVLLVFVQQHFLLKSNAIG